MREKGYGTIYTADRQNLPESVMDKLGCNDRMIFYKTYIQEVSTYGMV